MKIVTPQQPTIARELAIQGQLNARLHGALESLVSDLQEHSDWQHYSCEGEALYLLKYGLQPNSIGPDPTANAKRLSLVRQANKKLRATVNKLVDEIDEYSDPGYFASWAEASALVYVTPQAPVSAIAALRY